jgi:DNA-binding response OmpR family regulator/outer membrane protein OmpA-like peptidoglycan-associated protein
MRLLVAENDPALATFLQESFDHEHYAVDLTHESEEAKKWVEERDYDLAILDLNLARDEGPQVLQYCRAKRRELPILVLSGRNRAEDRVQILDLGADDLVLKPISFSELSARVRALLRRGGRAVETVLCIEDLELNRVEHSVKRAGRAIELTPKEFGLLEYLMRNAGQRVTRAQIIEHVWNLSFDTMTNVVDVYINYSSAQIDKRKAGQLAIAIQAAFQQMGIFDTASSRVALASAEPTPIADVQIIENVKRLQNLGQLPSPAQGPAAGSVDRPKMDELQKKLEDALALQIDNRIISVAPNKEGIVVSLREAGFFQSGSTQLGPQTIPALASIVKIIGPEKMDIRIEGHTDNVPIHNPKYDSNWELSTARATEIIKLFITKFALAANRLSASGYGEYYPTASNDTAEGRAMNRRVDLVILNSISDAGVPTPTVVAPDAIPTISAPQ